MELLNNFGNTSTVVYGGISDVFTIENSSNYKINLENLSLSNSVDASGGSSNAVGKKVYITFDSNGGIGEMPKQEFTVGNVSVLNQNVFVNDGYKFLKWNTASDGSGSDYFDCANVKIDRDLTLYAIWVTEEEVIYKIEHYKQNLKDNNYTLFESEYKTGMESDKLTQSAKEYIGYNLSNVVLSNEGTVVKVYYDCILCTVTFEFNDETINLDNTQVVKYGATVQKPEISSENKYFYNWYSDEDFTTIFDFATIVKEEITLYAKWIDLTSSSYATSSNVGSVIGKLSGVGPHYVKVTGEITSSTISTIRTKLINKSSCLVVLDLSETTGLTSIYKEAFYECSNLVDILLPDTITIIGDFSFYGCSKLESLEIPESVTSIGDRAFYNCSNLESIIISEGVTSIGENAFYNCISATIKLPNSISTFPNSAKYAENVIVNDDNPYFMSENGLVLSKDKKTLYFCRKDEVNIVIPETVDLVCEDVFANNDRIKSIKLLNPNTVTATSNFNDCTNLESVESIGNFIGGKFENCYKLKSVIGIGDSKLPSFRYCQDLELIYIKSKISEISTYCLLSINYFCEIEFEIRPKNYTSVYYKFDDVTSRTLSYTGPKGSIIETTDITALIKDYIYKDNQYKFTFSY